MCSLLLLGSGAISLFPAPRSLLNDVAGGGAWSTTLHRLSGRPLLRQCSSSSSSAVGNDPRWLSRILRRAQDGSSPPLPLPQRCHDQHNSIGGVTSAPWAPLPRRCSSSSAARSCRPLGGNNSRRPRNVLRRHPPLPSSFACLPSSS
jgi:hypothetical protein